MQPIFNIAEVCARKGIKNAVVSPGSRCAPLTIAFARHPEVTIRTFSDERSAAFIGAGISQQTGKPAVLVCTSGSAALNYYPAIAEAYFQQIPLIVLTADRPPEWIDQLDGQTIRQNNVYSSHIKGSYTLPVSYDSKDAVWEIERTVSEAINLSEEYPKGPVHINVPLREPFYPDSAISFSQVKVIEEEKTNPTLSQNQKESLQKELEHFQRILVVAGQSSFSSDLVNSLEVFSQKTGAVVIADIISNCTSVNQAITKQDCILSIASPEIQEDLKPDLVISFGLSVISKKLKTFLRKSSTKHWHIQEAGKVADTFQSLTKIVRLRPVDFFSNISKSKKINYKNLWLRENEKASEYMEDKIKSEKEFSELEVVTKVLSTLPDNSILHLSNSMPVRHANLVNNFLKKNIEVRCNRGTSGIDGVISTAYGNALATNKTVTVITGDMAFFYDRNAFWNNYLPENLRIIILNNHGGGIFNKIEGPSKQPELKEFFVTRQPLIAVGVAYEHEMEYFFCKTRSNFEKYLQSFYNPGNSPKIIEVEFSPAEVTE